MIYCDKCGAKAEDGMSFCPRCGAEIRRDGFGQQNTYYQQNTYACAGEKFAEQDCRSNRVMGVLAYLGVLTFIPVLAGDKTSEYVKRHCNQGLVLFILSVIMDVIDEIADHIILLGGIVEIGVSVIELVIFILAVMGIISACKGTRKPLPLVGQITIFK